MGESSKCHQMDPLIPVHIHVLIHHSCVVILGQLPYIFTPIHNTTTVNWGDIWTVGQLWTIFSSPLYIHNEVYHVRLVTELHKTKHFMIFIYKVFFFNLYRDKTEMLKNCPKSPQLMLLSLHNCMG